MLLYLYMVRLGPTIVGKVRGTNALIIIITLYYYTFDANDWKEIGLILQFYLVIDF